MRLRLMSVAYPIALLLAVLSGLMCGAAEAYFKPLAALDGVWSSRYYVDTPQGEEQIDALLIANGRSISIYGVASDAQQHIIGARSVRMTFESTDPADGTNLYTFKILYSRCFSPCANALLGAAPAGPSRIRARFYQMGRDSFILDLAPTVKLNYSAIFKRTTALGPCTH